MKHEKKNTYIVLQGMIDGSGVGNLKEVARFTDKKKAIKYFNRIKNDESGWTKSGILTTEVEICNYDETGYLFYEETIERHEKK